MPDYDALLSRQRGLLLGPEKTTGDIIRAGIQSTTGQPYGEALSNITADRYNRALSQYGVLSSERDFQTRRDQQMWERAQAEAEQGDRNVQRLLELSGAYGASAADAQRLAAAVIQRTETDNIDDPNAIPGLVAEEAQRLGLPARPELTLMSTAGGGVAGIDPLGRARTIVAGETEAPTPRTDIGKINADLAAGIITPAQAMVAQRDLYTDAGETWRSVTEEERTQYRIPEGQAAQISTTGKVQTIGRTGGITIYDPQTENIIAQIGGGPLTDTQLGKQSIEISEEIRATNERLSELSSSLRSLEQTPEATGIRGVVIERLGGVAEQIGDMVGVDGDWLGTAEVQQTRTQLASLLGRYIPTVTGDESGRYSDRDMQRAEAALPATRVTASYSQVRSALLTLGDIERRARARALMRLDGFGPEVDLTYQEGREFYAIQLFREGKNPEEAVQIIQELMDKYEITPGLEGIR